MMRKRKSNANKHQGYQNIHKLSTIDLLKEIHCTTCQTPNNDCENCINAKIDEVIDIVYNIAMYVGTQKATINRDHKRKLD